MLDLNSLSPNALSAAMRGGTVAWCEHGSATTHIRYAEPQSPQRRKKCHCGCGSRAAHRGMANGVCLMSGCEIRVRRWVRDGR